MDTRDKHEIDSIKRKPSATRLVFTAVVATLILLGTAYIVPQFRQVRKEEEARQLIDAAGGRAMKPDSRFIQFTGLEITDANLVRIRQLTETEILELHQTRITDNGLAAIANWKNLNYLCIQSDLLTDGALVYLRNLQQLERLELIGSKITDLGLNELAALTNLKILNLSCCTKLSQTGIQKLQASLPNCDIQWSPDPYVPHPAAAE
jgi:hypothetical protein